MNKETLITEDLTIEDVWTAVGAEQDVNASTDGVFYIAITRNDCQAIEVRMCTTHTVGEDPHEFVPRSDRIDADEAAIQLKRLKEGTHKFAFQLPSLKGVAGIVMQVKCVGHGDTKSVATAATLTHE